MPKINISIPKINYSDDDFLKSRLAIEQIRITLAKAIEQAELNYFLYKTVESKINNAKN